MWRRSMYSRTSCSMQVTLVVWARSLGERLVNGPRAGALTVLSDPWSAAHDRPGHRTTTESWGLDGDHMTVPITFPQVRGLKRRSWPVGRVLSPAALRPVGGRPSIWDHRCRWPRAVYPRTRAGSPRTYVRRWP